MTGKLKRAATDAESAAIPRPVEWALRTGPRIAGVDVRYKTAIVEGRRVVEYVIDVRLFDFTEASEIEVRTPPSETNF